jgi:N-acyl-D-aspartate/D-glutamate deacylase
MHKETLLEEALQASAIGPSSGLFTAPGNYADATEILALARVLARHGATYASHIRDEANHVFDAVREAIPVASATGIHVQGRAPQALGDRQLRQGAGSPLGHQTAQTLGDIARQRGADPLDAVCDYLIADQGHTRILVTSMGPEDVDEITIPTPSRTRPPTTSLTGTRSVSQRSS